MVEVAPKEEEEEETTHHQQQGSSEEEEDNNNNNNEEEHDGGDDEEEEQLAPLPAHLTTPTPPTTNLRQSSRYSCYNDLESKESLMQYQIEHQQQQHRTPNSNLNSCRRSQRHKNRRASTTYNEYLQEQRDLKLFGSITTDNNNYLSEEEEQEQQEEEEEDRKNHDTDDKIAEEEETDTAAAAHTGAAAAAADHDDDESNDNNTRNKQRMNNALSLLGRRRSTMLLATHKDWDGNSNIMAGIDDINNKANGAAHSAGGGGIPFYAYPMQRQRWGDDQVLPHVNWGDLFFDLFYVSAAYNLGSLLMSSMNTNDWTRGIVYYVGIFGPMYMMWEHKLLYEAKYMMIDYAHRLFEIVRFFFVAMAAVHITPLEYIGDSSSIESFVFCLSLALESVMQFLVNMELYFVADGDKLAIQNQTKRDMVVHILPTLSLYVSATIIAGILHFNHHDNSYTTASNAGYNNDYNATTTYNKDLDNYNHDEPTSNRQLGPSTSSSSGEEEYSDYYGSTTGGGSSSGGWSISDLPLALCCIAYVLNLVLTALSKIRLSRQVNIRDKFTPDNIDYLIHRYGEWIMLMIGESVLSLLIVTSSESREYYGVVSFGILTVIVLQAIKFESEPSHAEAHALWQSMWSEMSFSYMIQLLSMSLVAFGVSYKVFLKTILAEDEEEVEQHRMLADTPVITERAAAALYCGSLTIVLVSLELMLASHKGVKDNWKSLFHDFGSSECRCNWPLIILALFKLCVIVLAATLGQIKTEPIFLCFVGFFIVVSVAVSRIVGWGLIYKKTEIKRVLTHISKTPKVVSDISKAAAKTIGSSSNKLSRHTNRFGRRVFSKKNVKASSSDDISDSTSEALSETAFLANLLDTSFDAIVVTDNHGIIQDANETTRTMFGYDNNEELIGNNVSMLVNGHDAKMHDSYVKNFREGGRTSSVIGRQRVSHARRKDGTSFPCMVGIKEIPKTHLMVGYIRETTGNESVKERRQIMGSFVG